MGKASMSSRAGTNMGADLDRLRDALRDSIPDEAGLRCSR